MAHLLAQVPAEWIGPGSQLGASAILIFVLRWFMTTIAPQLRAIERALDFNTRATLLMGIAHDEASSAIKEKLRTCLKELDEREQSRKRRSRSDDENPDN